MANLSKLDETISELEKQAEIFKNNNKLFERVTEIIDQIHKGVSELKQGNSNFEEIKNEIHQSLSTLNERIESLEKGNEKVIESLISSNKKYIRELEDTVSSKLERFNSDIQVTIRQERTQIQEFLQNTFTSNLFNFESRQRELFASQKKYLIQLRIMLIIVVMICFAIGGLVLL